MTSEGENEGGLLNAYLCLYTFTCIFPLSIDS